jgi:UDP-N-acetylglucosamine 2-epimerase (non-hydrolysing)
MSPTQTKLVACIVGARPNFMKIAPIMEALLSRPRLRTRLIHTGQHFSPEMSESFFRDLCIPEPDENLGVAAGTQTQQTASMMRSLEESFLANRPDLVIVVGDVTSTLAATLVASKLGIPVAHVEAGLRSFDRRMPEEINRLVTDTLADYLFVSEPSGVVNLRAEGVPDAKIFFVGNVMIDTLLRFREQAMRSDVLERYGLEPKSYALATLHRPSNVDDPEQLRRLAGVLTRLSERLPVLFPVHPRTRQRLAEIDLPPGRLILTGPQGYLDFLRLMADARLVLTDSGGIQEETTILQVPCLTLRENTERPVTITEGTNCLVGKDPEAAYGAAVDVLDRAESKSGTPELWDGNAGRRIVDHIEKLLLGANRFQD